MAKLLELTELESVAKAYPAAFYTLEPTKWWESFGDNIYAMDCEHVHVPINGKKLPQCATVSIYNFKEKEVYNATVYYKPYSFYLLGPTPKINGFNQFSFIKGRPYQEIRKSIVNLLENNLCILIGGTNDISGLELEKEKITFYDLQEYYWSVIEHSNGGKQQCGHSLRSLVKSFFNESIQTSIHTASEDAKYTMKLFKHIYCRKPRLKRNPFPSSDIKRLP
ncbi:RNA exonuclease 4-like protein [Leptotrombidium deliense]|uniref:RNA exonuclease 4-like protein n=1 Tax=Leptotrombidium deliense TaxID=299467 RepID=A0A443RVT4_9ACAR|nr:RNA exonuclease 4-like protein [Leptotrombidium deliense]